MKQLLMIALVFTSINTFAEGYLACVNGGTRDSRNKYGDIVYKFKPLIIYTSELVKNKKVIVAKEIDLNLTTQEFADHYKVNTLYTEFTTKPDRIQFIDNNSGFIRSEFLKTNENLYFIELCRTEPFVGIEHCIRKECTDLNSLTILEKLKFSNF